MIEQTPAAVTWIKVEKPRLDLLGLIVRSLGATAVLALGALLAGAVLGFVLIRRRRRARARPGGHLTRLDLPDPRPGAPSPPP